MGKFQKTAGRAALLLGGIAGAGLAAAPLTAWAEGGQVGWNVNTIITGGSANEQLGITEWSAQSVSDVVTKFTTWLIGIVVVIFVLKVVLTAVDRLLFSNSKGGGGGRGGGGGNSGGGLLTQIPVVGAYSETMAWKDVWIHFGKNLAIVAGAWIIVQVISGIILWGFSAMQKTS